MENIKGEVDEVMRKGPWTEQEDVQLVLYVKLFGDRRWDFIAKVSGLKRTGKSCRLRWVNYLHPGLKRGKMTPHEQRLVLELYSKWGNRWSRIARKIPGRTDNEIKNYWRTHMRKKAQDQKKKSMSQSSSSSSSSSDETKGRGFYDTGGNGMDDFVAVAGENTMAGAVEESSAAAKVYSMDEIWKDIELSEESSNNFNMNSSPAWDFCPAADSLLWSMDEQDSKMMLMMQATDNYISFPFQNHMTG